MQHTVIERAEKHNRRRFYFLAIPLRRVGSGQATKRNNMKRLAWERRAALRPPFLKYEKRQIEVLFKKSFLSFRSVFISDDFQFYKKYALGKCFGMCVRIHFFFYPDYSDYFCNPELDFKKFAEYL